MLWHKCAIEFRAREEPRPGGHQIAAGAPQSPGPLTATCLGSTLPPAMLLRACLILALLALAPAFAFAQEDEPRVRCGEKYMTLKVVGAKQVVHRGPLTVRKADVRAIYVAYGAELTMVIDIGKTIIRPIIEPETLKPVLECLD